VTDSLVCLGAAAGYMGAHFLEARKPRSIRASSQSTTFPPWIRAELSQRKEVKVEVRDTGCSVPRDEVSRIFDRFYRVDKSRSVPGAGLGLSIAEELVESMNVRWR
jgi:signal transduction histidine kinase